MDDGRIRLTLLGGYLGAGKTTWLRHQLHEGVFAGAFVIVNEAAGVPVDDALLLNAPRMAVLAGGCACCSAKPELIGLLHRLCAEKFNHIVLELSGLADPRAIVDAIRFDARLAGRIGVGETVVLADALHALAQLRAEPLARRQIAAADAVIVTKLDAAEQGEARRLLASLHILNPRAALFGAVKGSEVPLPEFDDTEPEVFEDLESTSGPLVPSRLVLGDAIDWTTFSVWLSALLQARGDDIVRVKGVIRTPAGRLLVQAVRRIVQSPEILPEGGGRPHPDDNVIAVIGRGFAPGDLERSLRRFAAAGAE